MKDTEILYLNDQHEEIVESHLKTIKKLMYFATEDVDGGKYQDFLHIVNSIFLYSNNFHKTMVDKVDTDNGVVAEFIFLIPNMIFYTSIGFLTALKDGENDDDMKEALEKIGLSCENTTSELADIIIDESEKKQIYEEIDKIKVNQN